MTGPNAEFSGAVGLFVARELPNGASPAQVLNRDLGIVLGLCGHWWQARIVAEVMEKDCPRCGRPPGAFIDCWDETWPEPDGNPA